MNENLFYLILVAFLALWYNPFAVILFGGLGMIIFAFNRLQKLF